MKRTTVFLEEGLEGDLRALARRKAEPMASVVREALASYVAREKTEGAASPSFVAVGRSGHRDTAERHEDLLFREPASTERPKKIARSRRTAKPSRPPR